MAEYRYLPIYSPELSQNETQYANRTAGQWLLGALALFGAARVMPRVVRQIPGLRREITEGLMRLATRTNLEDVQIFFEALNLYTRKHSAIFSSLASGKPLGQQLSQRLRNLPREFQGLREAFKTIREGRDPRYQPRYFVEDAAGNLNFVMSKLSQLRIPRETQRKVIREWYEALMEESERRYKVSALSDLVDLHHLTVREALQRQELGLSKEALDDLWRFHTYIKEVVGEEAAERFLNMPLDYRVFVGPNGEIVDFRGLMEAYRRTTDLLATGWQVPFVKINPFTILGFGQIRTLQHQPFSQVFAQFSRGPALYYLRRGMPDVGDGHSLVMYVGGRVIEVTRAGEFRVSHGWLATTPGSQFGQHIRRMLGIPIPGQKFVPKGGRGTTWTRIAETLDLFRQEMAEEDLEIFTIDTWYAHGFNRFWRRLSPWRQVLDPEEVAKHFPQWADPQYGDSVGRPEFRVIFPRSRFSLLEMNFGQLWREITAGRDRPEDITMATLIAYTVPYKVNVALSQIGLGLSLESMGSTVDFFRNLLLKRILPVMGLFYGWRGINTFMGNYSPAVGLSEAVQTWQDIISGASDAIGLAERLQRLGELMPGIDQIAEFPILPLPNARGEISVLTLQDVLPLSLTPEELEEQRRYGLTPIRRARYWSVGNAPYTGSDIIGYVPHWSRIAYVPGDVSVYGPGARTGISMAPVADIPVVGGAITAISAGGGSSLWIDTSRSVGESYVVSSGPMGSFTIRAAVPVYGAGGGEDEGGFGFGGGAGGGNVSGSGILDSGIPYTVLPKIRGPISDVTYADPEVAGVLERMLGTAGRQVSDILGFTGFAIRTVTGIEPVRRVGIWAQGSIGVTMWHSQLGGFGGTISEVFRRFFPPEQIDSYGDMTPSGMPSWLPGPENFIDFQHGYAYHKVPMGHYMLPGPGFADLWDMPEPDFSLEAGMLGGGPSAWMAWWTYADPRRGGIDREGVREIRDAVAQAGFQVKMGGRVANPQLQIWTDVPFFIQYGEMPVPAFVAPSGEGPGGPTWMRAQFAAAQLGLPRSLIFRETEEGLAVEEVQPDLAVLRQLVAQAEEQREWTRAMILNGQINGMEFYHPAYRLLILAAVAPHSDQYRAMSKMVSGMKLTPELERVVDQAREIAEDNRKRLRVYPYQFLYQETREIRARVEQVLDKNRIILEGVANPIRLAGIRVLPGEEGQAAEEYLRQVLQSGTEVRVIIGANEAWKLGDETRSIRGIVEVGGVNISRELARMGLAVEDEDDDSVPGMLVRFSPLQRAFGRAWERFAHLPLITHTKFLQVKSPVEAYIDREIFGKSFQSWSQPISDFLVPTFQSYGRFGIIPATLIGGVIGYKFGAHPMGRLVFSLIGAGIGLISSAYMRSREIITGESYVPERRLRQWELEEYIDALKYVKALRNYIHFAERAKREEGFDVAAYIRELEEKRERNRYLRNILQAKKRAVQEAPPDVNAVELAAELGIPGEYETKRDLLREINRMLGDLQEDRDIREIGPLAAQALSWYKQARQTMQGWRPGDSIEDLIAALPAIDRKYFPMLLEAPPEELERLERYTPAYLMRAIRAARGEYELAPDIRSLSEIFAEHALPGPDWEGWRPEVDLGDVRIKIIRREGLDAHGMNVYPSDFERADRSGITNIPRVFDYNANPSAAEIERRLRSILGSSALQYDIEIIRGGDGLRIEVEHEQDRRDLIYRLLRGGDII